VLGRNITYAQRTTDVALVYSQALNTATVGNVRVFSEQRGGPARARRQRHGRQ